MFCSATGAKVLLEKVMNKILQAESKATDRAHGAYRAA